MGITPEDLVKHFPVLYHMAEAGTWASIKKRGLLSTSALLDLFEIKGQERHRIEGCRRPEPVPIRHPRYGTAVIRDNKPMSESALGKCLIGMTPTQWYRLLNGRVFFWLTPERVSGLLCARAYRDREHIVLAIDTAKLLGKYRADVTLSPINSGSTLYNPQPRSATTFGSLTKYPFDQWRKKRGSATKAVAELAVKYEVKDIDKMVIRVERRKQSKVLEVLYDLIS
jgi:hypothetical protein